MQCMRVRIRIIDPRGEIGLHWVRGMSNVFKTWCHLYIPLWLFTFPQALCVRTPYRGSHILTESPWTQATSTQQPEKHRYWMLSHTHAHTERRAKPSAALIHPSLWNIPILLFISLLLTVHSCHCHWDLLSPSWKIHCNAKQLLMQLQHLSDISLLVLHTLWSIVLSLLIKWLMLSLGLVA